ncbi:hypothetical protein G9A89_009336 [Geosiphon pyriformis]|nr:hypothetical protein G9A89_009336 [Geosiphon pyriformis]
MSNNSIIVPIKILVIEATQYQALNTQELQISQNSQHICVPAMCGHFKPITMTSAPLIEFEKKERKPIWKAYQNTTNYCQYYYEMTKKRKKEKKNLPRKPTKQAITNLNLEREGKKKKERTRTSHYFNIYFIYLLLTTTIALLSTKAYMHQLWQEILCLACGETFLDEGMWNDIPERGETYDKLRAVKHLDRCLHNDDEIWQMALAKIEEISPEEIKTIKNNPSESIELD